MQLIRNHPLEQGCVLTIGNFDGLHLGHQQLIRRTVSLAQHLHVPACVLTFLPFPKEFFEKKAAPRILPLQDKLKYLEQWGVDIICLQRFHRPFAALTPEEFVEDYLLNTLHVKQVVVGEDFRFGVCRLGDTMILEELLGAFDVPVDCLPPVQLEHRRVSSSWVKEALGTGDLGLVQRLLGRAYQISGKVRQGAGRGRSIGFPTANVDLKKPLVVQGVYAATVSIRGREETWNAVVNIGVRPTFAGKRFTLEAHLLGVEQELYNEYIVVTLIKKIREEQKFASVEELRQQIGKDVLQAQQLLLRGTS